MGYKYYKRKRYGWNVILVVDTDQSKAPPDMFAFHQSKVNFHGFITKRHLEEKFRELTQEEFDRYAKGEFDELAYDKN